MCFIQILNPRLAEIPQPIFAKIGRHDCHHRRHHTNIISVVQRTASRTLNKVNTARRERNSATVKTGSSQRGTFLSDASRRIS